METGENQVHEGLPMIPGCRADSQVESEMRRVWPDRASRIHLSVWAMIREKEGTTQRDFLVKMDKKQ